MFIPLTGAGPGKREIATLAPMDNKTMKELFLLNPEISFLNFGSFGACPKPVFEDYQKWQRELEFEPVRFMAVNGPAYLQRSREALAKYIGCAADEVVYTTNPTYAINIIAKSLKLMPGDEVLSTNLEYGALDRTWNYYCKKAGARYVRQPITLPLISKEKFIEDFFGGLSPTTKAIFISQITSTTGLIFPVKEICTIAKQKGLFTIVDGAHVPGHIPINLSELDADVFTGACHKWMMTPKGCSFLYVKKQFQDLFDPVIISWGYEAQFPSSSRFLDYHQMQGTRDFSAFLTVPRAIAFMDEHKWHEVAAGCRKLAHDNYLCFCTLLNAQPLAPHTDEFFGQMRSIKINTPEPEKLHLLLFDKYKVQVPVMRQDDKVYLRYSVNAFNSQADLDRLFNALEDIKASTTYIK